MAAVILSSESLPAAQPPQNPAGFCPNARFRVITTQRVVEFYFNLAYHSFLNKSGCLWSIIISSLHTPSYESTRVSFMLVTRHSTCSSKLVCLFIQNSVRVPTGILHVSMSVWIKLKGDWRHSGKCSRMFLSVPSSNPCSLVSKLVSSLHRESSRPGLISSSESVTMA